MKLTRYKLGELIKEVNDRNTDEIYTLDHVKGISVNKIFIETKANMKNVSLKPYKIIEPDTFAYVTITSRNSDKITLAYNRTKHTYICSSSYIVFQVEKKEILLPEYLYIFFSRPEFDRYARFNSWGSAREAFSGDDMCDIDIDLPPIEIQQKYVDIYKGMLENQKSYETGLEDLKLTCDAYVERLKHEYKYKLIGDYILETNERNENLEINNPQGIDIVDGFTEPKRIAKAEKNAKIVRTGQFAFNKVIKANGTRIPIGYREKKDCTISSSYIVFEVCKKNELNSKYLMLWLSRLETQRYAGFMSLGSTRDTISFNDLCEVKIPIPPIEIQNAIADIYTAYKERKSINEKLKAQIKDICPILIKGSLEEARKG